MANNAGDGRQGMARAKGFTLIELMIVVVIIAILAAIAIPAYGRYAYRARRPDGQELLLRIANAQERYYATNNKYSDLATVGFTAPVNSEKSYYVATAVISADPAGNASQAYVVTAAPVGSQVTDACLNLTINNAGVRAFTGNTTNGNCW